MRLTVLTHVDFEGPAAIADWAELRGHEVDVLRMHHGDPFPAPRSVDMIAVMGGPMSVHDHGEHSWLQAERAFLGQVVETGAPMLGVCLGAQLLAQVLGADVFRNAEPEIGFYPVAMSSRARALDLFNRWPSVFEAAHWHGETFTLPHGAVSIGSSEATANQGFVYQGRVVGLQFHVECTPESWDALMDNCADEIACGGNYVQTSEAMRAGYERMRHFCDLLHPLLDGLAGQVM